MSSSAPLVFVVQKWNPHRGLSRHLVAIARRYRDQGRDVRIVVGPGSSWRAFLSWSVCGVHEEPAVDDIPVTRVGFSRGRFVAVVLALPFLFLLKRVSRRHYLSAVAGLVSYGLRASLVRTVSSEATCFLFGPVFPHLLLAVSRLHSGRVVLFPLLHTMEAWASSVETREVVASADAVCVSTEHERAWIGRELGRTSGVVVAGLGEFDVSSSAGSPTRFRCSNAIPEDVPVVVFVGSMRAQRYEKGFRELLTALPALWRVVPETHVVFVGTIDASVRDLFSTVSDERLHVLGRVSDEDREAAYATATCVVYPSASESFGGVILEAWRHACPVVVSDIAVFAEIVGSGGGGQVVPAEPQALAEAIAGYVSDPFRARADGERGRAILATRYSWDQVLRQVDRALRVEQVA